MNITMQHVLQIIDISEQCIVILQTSRKRTHQIIVVTLCTETYDHVESQYFPVLNTKSKKSACALGNH